jgi:hypothetical protein
MINTYGIYVHCGSSDDADRRSGTAHLLEHIIFNSASAKAITQNGGVIKAITEREKTFYLCQIPEDGDTLFSTFLHFVKNPTITHEIVLREKRNVACEYTDIHRYEITAIIDSLYKLIFPKSGMGNSIVGSPSSIDRIGVNDVRTFHKKHYYSSNIVVIQTGSQINEHYSPNGHTFSFGCDRKIRTYEINTSTPKFGWEMSSSDINIYLCAFPFFVKSKYEQNTVAFLTDLLQHYASTHDFLYEKKRNIPSQFALQCKSYDGISIIFCLIGGSERFCKESFRQLRGLVQNIYKKGFTNHQIQQVVTYRQRNRRVRMLDPCAEMNRYLNSYLLCSNITQFEESIVMHGPQIDTCELNECVGTLFDVNNMHYYARCKSEMYSLPFMIYI